MSILGFDWEPKFGGKLTPIKAGIMDYCSGNTLNVSDSEQP
jgi:hypothetical protein